MRIGFLSDPAEGTRQLGQKIRTAVEASGHHFETVDRSSPDLPLLHKVVAMINLCDLIAAAPGRDENPNLWYEIGLAHGLRKPVVFLIPESTGLPSELLTQRSITYGTGAEGLERAVFTFEAILAQYEKHSSRLDVLLGPFEELSTAAASAVPVGSFRDLYALRAPLRAIQFEQWFGALLRGIPGIEILESTKTDSASSRFDFLLWNADDDPDLRILGNPIPVVLKSSRLLNAQTARRIVDSATNMQLKSIIFANTAHSSKSLRRALVRFDPERPLTVIDLDRDALIDVSTSKDLLMAIKTQVREQTLHRSRRV